MIDVNLLQTKEHHQYCVSTLAILLSLISNIQLVFQRLDDLDFVTDMLNMQVVKKVVSTQNCAFCAECAARAAETRIEDDIYYGDLLDHYRHLLPKSQFQTKVTMSVIDVNESLCQKCSMQILSRGANLSQCLLIQRIPVSSIQRNLEVVQECEKELSACQLKQAIQFLQQNKQVPTQLVVELLNAAPEASVFETARKISAMLPRKFTFDDKYRLLHQLFYQEANRKLNFGV